MACILNIQRNECPLGALLSKKEHQDEIKAMYDELKNLYVVFVCGTNGTACLSYEEMKMVLDQEHKETEWIGIWRGAREKFQVKGTDGALKFKIGENEFPNKIFEKRPLIENILNKI